MPLSESTTAEIPSVYTEDDQRINAWLSLMPTTQNVDWEWMRLNGRRLINATSSDKLMIPPKKRKSYFRHAHNNRRTVPGLHLFADLQNPFAVPPTENARGAEI